MIRERERRYHYFDAGLLSDPAWDILLDLFLAELEGRSVSVTSLCCAMNAPETTALRWIRTMVEDGMLVRARDPSDRRRVFVRLGPDAHEAMKGYVEDQKAYSARQKKEAADERSAFCPGPEEDVPA